jgi:hypothetical protein
MALMVVLLIYRLCGSSTITPSSVQTAAPTAAPAISRAPAIAAAPVPTVEPMVNPDGILCSLAVIPAQPMVKKSMTMSRKSPHGLIKSSSYNPSR